MVIKTLEGEHLANIGDYIIRGVCGEFYPCKPDIFKKTYEEVEAIECLESTNWIPVSERLPEDEKECLVTLEKVYGTPEKLYGIASYLKFGDTGYWNERKYGYLEWDKYSDGHGGTKMYKVIAWKPLPEPYKEG